MSSFLQTSWDPWTQWSACWWWRIFASSCTSLQDWLWPGTMVQCDLTLHTSQRNQQFSCVQSTSTRQGNCRHDGDGSQSSRQHSNVKSFVWSAPFVPGAVHELTAKYAFVPNSDYETGDNASTGCLISDHSSSNSYVLRETVLTKHIAYLFYCSTAGRATQRHSVLAWWMKKRLLSSRQVVLTT